MCFSISDLKHVHRSVQRHVALVFCMPTNTLSSRIGVQPIANTRSSRKDWFTHYLISVYPLYP
jgi:hypothetical protein